MTFHSTEPKRNRPEYETACLVHTFYRRTGYGTISASANFHATGHAKDPRR